jgi:hypothetical protein
VFEPEKHFWAVFSENLNGKMLASYPIQSLKNHPHAAFTKARQQMKTGCPAK